MLGAVRGFVDLKRPLVQRPSAREVALSPEQIGEVVETRRGRGMLWAERLLAHSERALEQRPRLGIGPKREIPVSRKPIEKIGCGRFRAAGHSLTANQIECERVESPRPRPD